MADALCIYWRFNDVKDKQVVDASGHNNNGHIQPDTELSESPLVPDQPISDVDEWGEKVPLGFSFRGNVQIDCVDGFSADQSFTLEFYMRRSRVRSGGLVDSILEVANVIRILVTGQGTIALSVGRETYDTKKRIVINQWMHFALINNSKSLELLIDGVPCFSNIHPPILFAPIGITLGSGICDMTEFRLFAKARSKDEIREFLHSPLPRKAPISKWKGLKIKTASNQSVDSKWPPTVPAIQTKSSKRRIINSDIDEISLAEFSRVTSQVVPDDPVSAEESVLEFPGSSNPLPCPQIDDNFLGSIDKGTTPTRTPESEIPYSQNSLPVLEIPSTLERVDAIAKMDSILKSLLVDNSLIPEENVMVQVTQNISRYMRRSYRMGPYLCPLPSEAFLSGLRIACAYIALARCNRRVGGYYLNLRIPLLPERVRSLTEWAISEMRRYGDGRGEWILIYRLIDNFKTDLANDEINKFRIRLLEIGNPPSLTKLCCPICRALFQDPTQAKCSTCQTNFAVCFVMGCLVPSDECVKCWICHSEFSIGPAIPKRGNVSTNRSRDIPLTCSFCECTGTLRPLD
jgi:hypothetical protein